MPSEFNAGVYRQVQRIPRGQVTNYGHIALLTGRPRCARAVGYALHNNPDSDVTPCHRVVFKDGTICDGYAFGGPAVQRRLLEEEGVVFLSDGRVDMERCGWYGEAE